MAPARAAAGAATTGGGVIGTSTPAAAAGGMAPAPGAGSGIPEGMPGEGEMVGAMAEKPWGSACTAVLATGTGWPTVSGGGVGG